MKRLHGTASVEIDAAARHRSDEQLGRTLRGGHAHELGVLVHPLIDGSHGLAL